MQMINRFQAELLRVAHGWAARGCRESVANGGPCIDEVHRLFGQPRREAYCAKFVWVVADEAARAAGITNPLPKTAGACDMLTRAVAAGLRVDTVPAIGAVGYRSTTLANSTGHVLLVVDVTGDEVRTVEGNNGDRIDDWRYPMATVRNYPRYKNCQRGIGWDFIHIEDAGGAPTIMADTGAASLISAGPSIGSILLLLGTIAGAYAATNALRS
jgi:surface antigen